MKLFFERLNKADKKVGPTAAGLSGVAAGFAVSSLIVDRAVLIIPALLALLVVAAEYVFQFVQVVKEEGAADDL